MASREWIRFNDDSRARNNRDKYITSHGGEFVKNEIGRGWQWRPVASIRPAGIVRKPRKATKKVAPVAVVEDSTGISRTDAENLDN